MKKIKKLTALILAGVMMTGLASCGGEKQTDEMPTLKWYMQGEAPADLASVMEKANEILVPEIGAKLEMVYIDSAAYTERMNMNMASGEAYDLCFVGYVNPFLNAVENGGLLAIDKYLADCKELKESLPDFVFEAGKYGGETYAIPNYQIMSECTALYIYKDLADEYGLNTDEIKTLYDIEPFLEWVKKTHPDIYPFQSGGGGGLNGCVDPKECSLTTTATGVGVKYEEDGGLKAYFELEGEKADDEAKLMSDWYQKGYIRQDISMVTDQTADEKAGKYACWRATWKPGAEQEYEAVRGREVVSVRISNGTLSSNLARQTMIGVGANTKNPEKAVKFIQEINTNKDLYNLIAFGIEGKHFDFDENNRVVYRPDSGYEPGMTWRFGCQFNAYLLPGQADDTWEVTKEFNESSFVSPLSGFAFNADKVKTEIAQISQIYSKYPARKTGVEPVDSYWDKMKQEIMDAGVDRVIEEAQRQLDEFVASKQ